VDGQCRRPNLDAAASSTTVAEADRFSEQTINSRGRSAAERRAAWGMRGPRPSTGSGGVLSWSKDAPSQRGSVGYDDCSTFAAAFSTLAASFSLYSVRVAAMLSSATARI